MDINPVYRSASKRPRSTSENKYGKTPSTAPAKKRKYNKPNVNTSMNAQILNANHAATLIINSAINDYRNPKTDNPNGDDSTCTIYLGGQCDVISEQGKRHIIEGIENEDHATIFEIDSHVISLVCDGIGSTPMNGELAKGFVDSLESLTMDSIREGNLEDIIYSTDENIPTESILKEIFQAIMRSIDWHHSKSDATTFNLTVYNKKTQELSALVLGDSPTFIFKEDEYIRTKESTMNEGKAPLQIDSRQLQLFGGEYWCVDNFYPNLSRRRNPNFIQPKIQSYNNVIGFVSCSDGGAKGMTENMIASIHQRMKNLSPTSVSQLITKPVIHDPKKVKAASPAIRTQQGDIFGLGGQIIRPLSRSDSSAFENPGVSSKASSSDCEGASAAYGADLTPRNTGTQNQQANLSNAASSTSVVLDLEESSDEEEFDPDTYGQSVEPNPSTDIEIILNRPVFNKFYNKIRDFNYTKKELKGYFVRNTDKANDFLDTIEEIIDLVNGETLMSSFNAQFLPKESRRNRHVQKHTNFGRSGEANRWGAASKNDECKKLSFKQLEEINKLVDGLGQ